MLASEQNSIKCFYFGLVPCGNATGVPPPAKSRRQKDDDQMSNVDWNETFKIYLAAISCGHFQSYTQWTSVGHIFHCFVQFSSTTPLIRTACSSSLNWNFCQVFHSNRCYRLLIILFILQQTSVTTKLCQNVSHKLLPIIILLNCCQKFFCQTVVTNCCSHV